MRVCFLDPLEERIKDFPGRYLADHQVSYANGRPADVPPERPPLIAARHASDREVGQVVKKALASSDLEIRQAAGGRV